MKKILFGLMFSMLFIGCSPVLTPLSGKYQEKVFEIQSSKDFESVWSNVIDLFAQQGIPIQVIDKSSGLIVSGQYSLLNNYTFEKENGELVNPNAYVVIQKITWMETTVVPEKLNCTWNVRLKKNESGMTTVNVNLILNEGYRNYPQSQYTAARTFTFDAKSTGNFEKYVASIIQ